MDIIRNSPLSLGEKSRRLIFLLREYFFPEGCALCGAALLAAREAWYGLCENCRNAIEAQWAEDHLAGRRCDLCGRPLVSERERCLSCREQTRTSGRRPRANAFAFDRATVLFPYTGKYRPLLHAYKFGKNLAAGNFFAEKIQEALARARRGGSNTKAFERIPPDAVIVPVPPRPGKIRETGWDQVEYLVTLLERPGTAYTVSRCLRRLPSKAQKTLNRAERETNLRGRVLLKAPAPKTAVLVDDIMTTGSTLDACAAVLKAGGAEQVYGMCLFYN